MLGIENIACYLPEKVENNFDLADKFELQAHFIEDKIGVVKRPIKEKNEDTSDMAVKALQGLVEKTNLEISDIEVLIVVTQNPDYNIPHVSGLVHGKSGLPETCATFDISLGCSGYVYGLSIIMSFMQASNMNKGVLITADPYSKIIDREDKNTSLLFADAATATLIGTDPILECESFSFGSRGDLKRSLICEDGQLEMNGRDIFNFAATAVPKVVTQSLQSSKLDSSEIDSYLFHQGSGFILDTLTKRMKLNPDKVVNGLRNTGNTVSSSIPLLLEKELDVDTRKLIILCGFGVGLSYASCVCKRKELINDSR